MRKQRFSSKADHSYRIFGNVFELRVKRPYKGRYDEVLYKRYFVSPEFIQLFYKIHDEQPIDEELYNRLSTEEKKAMSVVVNYLQITSPSFNIALAKTMRTVYERLKVIEGAVMAGNLSKELQDEYVDIMKDMKMTGALPSNIAQSRINQMRRTYKALNEEVKK